MNNHTDRRCQPIEKRNIRPAYTRLANNEAVAVLIEQTRCLEREKRQNFRSGNVIFARVGSMASNSYRL